VNTPDRGVTATLAALRLDDPELVESGDPAGMLRQIASSAAQIRSALRAAEEADLSGFRPDSRPRAIVVAGTGGSAFAGEVLAAVCGTGTPVQVVSVHGYQLPGWVGAADLVIAVSASGASEATLALAAEAVRRGCDFAGVGAAGTPLQEMAVRARGAYVPVTVNGLARSAPWSLAVPLLVIASRLGVARIDAPTCEDSAVALEEIAHQCRPSSESFVNPGKSLALDLVGALPMIWGGSLPSLVAARRFASQLAASAKYPALAGALPDVGHDQVAVFDGPFAPAPAPQFPEAEDFDFDSPEPEPELSEGTPVPRLVLIADPAGEYPPVTRTREAAASLAAARGIDVSELSAAGEHPLRRLTGVVQLTDYAAAYLGIACGIDPSSGAAIGDLRDFTERAV
jgi:glucose/mannose-6-phosphate isomerase